MLSQTEDIKLFDDKEVEKKIKKKWVLKLIN